MATTTLHPTACILCELNCGIHLHLDENEKIVKITGDPEHPNSKGYICQKATRLTYYQDQERLNSPLRRKVDGSFEEISWDIAIQEIADKLVHIRDTHGGETIAYAGGGGQGNHLGGMYASALRAACNTPYLYSSLAQEKTGNFWVHGHLFGRQNTNYCSPVAEAEFVLLIGTNPMQSHGIVRARRTINEVSRDPNRTLVVIDVRNTETARKADHFIQVKPGRDAWLMAAVLAYIIQNELEDKEFLQNHTVGFEEIKPHFMRIPIATYAKIAGVELTEIECLSKGMVEAKTMAVRTDLGLEMSYNSTLNAYLARLLFLVTGHFGREGTNHLVTYFFPLLGHSREPGQGGVTTQVTGMKAIAKLFPPAVLPKEIDSDHPKRLRALWVESCNPVANWPDTQAQIEAYKKLDLMVVVDVAMTETARQADYILPASSQYEKVESTFFAENFYHLRKPVFKPLANTLPEPEIHTRILKAMGEIPESMPELEAAAIKDKENPGKGILQMAFMKALSTNANWKAYAPILLKETLGKALRDGMEAAALIWFTSQLYAQKYPEAVRNAGFEGANGMLGEDIFKKILESPSGIKLSEHNMGDHWDLIKHPDKKVHLAIPELLAWMGRLPEIIKEIEEKEASFPFNLIAGERRTYNANAILRNPQWRKSDPEGALKINPMDAEAYGIENGDAVRLSNTVGSVNILAKVMDEVPQGVLSMPHGHGLQYGDIDDFRQVGANPNMLTDLEACDPLAKTPYHKNVRVKLEKL